MPVSPFDQVITRFWDAENTYGVGPPLTPAMIADQERELGVRLPGDYLALMRVRNGGGVIGDLDGFPLDPPRENPNGPPSEFVWISQLDEVAHLWRSEDFDEPDYMPAGLVIIGTSDGHAYLALDYRECGPQGEPSIVFVDTELDTFDHLAPTFRALLEGLRPTASFPSMIALEEQLAAEDARPWHRKLVARLRGRR